MDASDKAIGRKLVAIARHSPFELVDAIAWGLGHELRGGWRCPHRRAEHRRDARVRFPADDACDAAHGIDVRG